MQRDLRRIARIWSHFFRLRPAIPILILTLACSSLPAQDALPPVPTLSESLLGRLQPSVRKQIQQAVRAAHTNAQDAEAVGDLGMVLHAYEKYELAGNCYERARGLDPRDFRWTYYAGLIAQRLGQDENAVARLSKAVEQQPQFMPARLRLAQSLFAAGKLGDSRRLYEEIIKDVPQLALAHYGLGEVLLAMRETPAALQSFSRATEHAPDFGAAHYALGLQYRNLGRMDQSQKHLALYQIHQEAKPALTDALVESVEKLRLGAITHFNRGRHLENDGRIEEAAHEYQRTLAIDPSFGQAHVNLISIYSLLGQLERAEAHYRKGLEVNPKLAELHYNYGLLLTQRQRYPEAVQAFRKALELNAYFADAHNNLGTLLEQQGKTTETEEHFRSAVENNPAHRLAYFNLGRILVKQREYEGAISCLLKTLHSRDEKTPTFLYVLADAYVKNGDIQNGLHRLTEAIQEAKSLEQWKLADTMEDDLRRLKQRAQ